MNKDIIKGKWTQLKGEVQKRWADLTDDDLQYIDGQRQYLAGKIQERYGRNKEQAEREVEDFERNLPSQYR